jgi:hypothetical protein
VRIRGFEEKEGKDFFLTWLKVCVWPHGLNIHFHGFVESLFVKTGALVSKASNGNRINGIATPSTSAVGSTMRRGKGLTKRERGRAIW